MTMRRLVKFWAIRLLGREFYSLSPRERRCGLWWCMAFILLLSVWSNNILCELGIVTHFLAASGALVAAQRQPRRRSAPKALRQKFVLNLNSEQL